MLTEEKQQMRNDLLYDFIIKTVRHYLNSNKIIFEETKSPKSESYYFKLNLKNGQKPEIRISCHDTVNYYSLSFLVHKIGIHSSYEQIRKRVIRNMDSLLRKMKKNKVKDIFEKLDREKNNN